MGSCFGSFVRAKDTELAEVPAGYGKKQSVLMHQQKHWAVTGVVSVRDGRLKVRSTYSVTCVDHTVFILKVVFCSGATFRAARADSSS